jgi:hypothetical protein
MHQNGYVVWYILITGATKQGIQLKLDSVEHLGPKIDAHCRLIPNHAQPLNNTLGNDIYGSGV